MKFKNVNIFDDGHYEFSVMASGSEIEFLVDYAVQDLLREGIIHITTDEDKNIDLSTLSILTE